MTDDTKVTPILRGLARMKLAGNITPTRNLMLKVMASLDGPAPCVEIARRCDMEVSTLNAQFGRMAHEIEPEMGAPSLMFPDADGNDTPFWSGYLVTYDVEAKTWEMKPEAKKAVKMAL